MVKKKHIPWNKGKKGVQVAWNKGIPMTEEMKKRISNKKKGIPISEEWKKKISESLKGKYKGKSRYWNWKGDEATYRSKHCWITRNYGKASKCSNPLCKNKEASRFHWANISGEHNRDINDYISLCCSCHMKMDETGYKSWKKRRLQQTAAMRLT